MTFAGVGNGLRLELPPLLADLAEARAQKRGAADARRAALRDDGGDRFRRDHDEGMIDRPADARHVRKGRQAHDLAAARIDRVDLSAIAVLPQEALGQRGVLVGVARGADQRDTVGRKQGLGEGRGHSIPCHDRAFASAGAGRCGNDLSNTCSAMRFSRISVEPPAIIQPRVRRKQYSASDSSL